MSALVMDVGGPLLLLSGGAICLTLLLGTLRARRRDRHQLAVPLDQDEYLADVRAAERQIEQRVAAASAALDRRDTPDDLFRLLGDPR